MESIEEISSLNTKVILIGNKIDLEDLRQVKKEEGERRAKEYGIPFYETSCKDGINVNEVFERITNDILNKNTNNDKNDNDKREILRYYSKKKKSKCC